MNASSKLFDFGYYSRTNYFENWPFRAIDIAFADLIHYLSDKPNDTLALIGAYVSWQTGQQHSCVMLAELSGALGSHLPLNWQDMLLSSQVVGSDAQPDKPLIVSNGRLYLQRYWHYETQLQQHIQRIEEHTRLGDLSVFKTCLERAFCSSSVEVDAANEQFDWQKNAVALCLLRQFCVISGGPGTGKTTTVARLIQSLQDYAQTTRQRLLTIRLAAPTGKAAARLTHSLSLTLQQPAQALFTPCVTLHNLMGVKGKNGAFFYSETNPLHLDVLIIDEASMVDLALMTKVLSAVPEHGRVVLLGDTNQLASVDVGNVLADICMAGQALHYSNDVRQQLATLLDLQVPEQVCPVNQPIDKTGNLGTKIINDRVAWLHKSYRFSAQSAIGQLARAFLAGDANDATRLLSEPGSDDLVWQTAPSITWLVETMYDQLSDYLECVKQGAVEASLLALTRFQVLAAHKKGPLGVANINQKFEAFLLKKGLIQDALIPYPGKPVMVTRNAANLGLYNGDVGIYMPDPENLDMLKIWFLIEGKVKGFLPARVPQFETSYCMTVHKSQGSEFDQVIVCLNEIQGRQSNLTRELLYTGLTRAKKRFQLIATPQAVVESLNQRVKRASGLAARLLEHV